MTKINFGNQKDWRKFGLFLTLILTILEIIRYAFWHEVNPYFYVFTLCVFILSLTFPIILKPVYILFLYLGQVMNWFMTKLILLLLFILVFTPISLITKLFGKKFLETQIEKDKVSYWKDKQIIQDKTQYYERQF